MAASDPQLGSSERQALLEAFRKLKHDINNTLAVFMAYSELAQRNPAHFEKLAKAILERGPQIVEQLHEFQLALQHGPAPAEPPQD